MRYANRAIPGCLLLTMFSAAPLPVAAVAISGQGSWETSLLARDLDGDASTVEAYYDTVLDITWLADTYYAGTEMTWNDAVSWVGSLDINGITGWRLPTVSPQDGVAFDYTFTYNGSSDVGYNISAPATTYAGGTASELAHMFFNTLGNKAFCDPVASTATTCSGSQPGWGLKNTGPFTNLATSHYWTGLEFAPDTNSVWDFNFVYGYQLNYDKSFEFIAWAVHSGDVGSALVPLPAAAWMFGSGITALWCVARRRRRSTELMC